MNKYAPRSRETSGARTGQRSKALARRRARNKVASASRRMNRA